MDENHSTIVQQPGQTQSINPFNHVNQSNLKPSSFPTTKKTPKTNIWLGKGNFLQKLQFSGIYVRFQECIPPFSQCPKLSAKISHHGTSRTLASQLCRNCCASLLLRCCNSANSLLSCCNCNCFWASKCSRRAVSSQSKKNKGLNS